MYSRETSVVTRIPRSVFELADQLAAANGSTRLEAFEWLAQLALDEPPPPPPAEPSPEQSRARHLQALTQLAERYKLPGSARPVLEAAANLLRSR